MVVKYTNVAFETDESVLFIEVSSIQRCPDRERGSTIILCVCLPYQPLRNKPLDLSIQQQNADVRITVKPLWPSWSTYLAYTHMYVCTYSGTQRTLLYHYDIGSSFLRVFQKKRFVTHIVTVEPLSLSIRAPLSV